MNATRVPNPSDENSILITAEFFEDGHRLRTDRTRLHRYELDLIVPDDITLEQLLAAVHDGICTQLSLRYQIDPYDLDANPAYLDTIRRFEQMQHRSEQLPREFFRERKLRSPLHYRHHAAVSAWARFDDTGAPEEPAPSEEDLWRWLVCWDVFCCCHDQYLQGYPEQIRNRMRVAFKQKAYPRHPVIACGSISTRSWSDEALRSLAKHTQIWLQRELHGDKTLRELGFFSSSRLIFDPNSHHSATPWFDALELSVPEEEHFPLYNTSKRPDVQPIPADIHIDDPGSLRQPPVPTVFLAVGALLAGAAFFLPPALLAAYLRPMEESLSAILFSCGTLLALAAAWASFRKLRQSQRVQWYHHYETYIRELLHRLRIIQQENTAFLLERYPPAYALEDTNDLVERAFRLDGSISGRRADQQDFLHVRIGLSREGSQTTHSLVRFRIPERSDIFSSVRYKNLRSIRSLPFRIIPPDQQDEWMEPNDGTVGFLNSLAEDIRDTYTWLDNAPVLMDLHHARAMGVCFQDPACSFYPLLNNMLLDLCYHHSPEDLQLVMFCPPISGIRKQQAYIRQFKQLPHFQQLLRDQSQFVFDPYYAAKVMDQLYHIHTLRRNAPEAAPHCHIILLLLDDHGFRQHQLAKLLPASAEEIETDDNDITFLFFSHSETQLPPYCSHVLKLDSDRSCYYIPYVHRFTPGVMRPNPLSTARYGIIPDGYASCFLTPGAASDHDRMYQSFKILSALRQSAMAQSALPRQLGLYRLLELSHPELPGENWFHAPGRGGGAAWQPVLAERIENFTRKQWSLSEQHTDLCFPIGAGSHRPVWMNLDQMTNVLIASDRGMGKTESMVTFLKSLCLHHSPGTARLFLVDPRTSGLGAQMDGWPQVAMVVDDTAAGGLSAALMKMFGSLRDEIRRRRADLNLMGVNSIGAYNQALLDLDTHILERLKLHQVRDEQLIDRLRSMKRMPRLILAADHADQIAFRLQADGTEQTVLRELQWLLENGGDYGVHVILAAARPDNILPRELWPHFQGRLCLKTENARLSEQMLGSQLAFAPSMPGAGRAYVRSALTGETDYVQIALCRDVSFAAGTLPFRVTLMEPGGPYLLFYDSEGEISEPPKASFRPPVMPGSGGAASGQGKSGKRRADTHRKDRKRTAGASGRTHGGSGPEHAPGYKVPDDHVAGSGRKTGSAKASRGYTVPDDYVPGSGRKTGSAKASRGCTVPDDYVPGGSQGAESLRDDGKRYTVPDDVI